MTVLKYFRIAVTCQNYNHGEIRSKYFRRLLASIQYRIHYLPSRKQKHEDQEHKTRPVHLSVVYVAIKLRSSPPGEKIEGA